MSPPPLALEIGDLRPAFQEGNRRDGVQQEVAKSICLDDALWQLLADFWQSFGINVFFRSKRGQILSIFAQKLGLRGSFWIDFGPEKPKMRSEGVF